MDRYMVSERDLMSLKMSHIPWTKSQSFFVATRLTQLTISASSNPYPPARTRALDSEPRFSIITLRCFRVIGSDGAVGPAVGSLKSGLWIGSDKSTPS